MRIVRVVGDLAADDYLLVMPDIHPEDAEQTPGAHVGRVASGAAALARHVGLACADLADVQVQGPMTAFTEWAPDGVQSAFGLAIWAPYPRVTGHRERVWRIERRYGPWPAIHPRPVSADDSLPDRPSVLVIGDAGLGYRDDPRLWPEVLREPPPGLEVVLHEGAPLARGRLWNHLVEHIPDRLTVVLAVAALRARQAAIAQALSWDRLTEDLDYEMTEGLSGRDLGRAHRVVVYVRGAGVAAYVRPPGQALARARLIYDPEELEGTWHMRRPGRVPGETSILTAAIVRHVLEPASFPLFVAAGRALAAIRAHHEQGGGDVAGHTAPGLRTSFQPDRAASTVGTLLHPLSDVPAAALPERVFRAAFPHAALGTAASGTPRACRSDLLQDATGRGYEYVAATAMQVVIRGVDRVLDSVPKAHYGAYVTVDREEIERINEIARLIMSYQSNESDTRPLSIAVFGPPGSGKSFAIKQLAAQLFGASQVVLEFNLSQVAARAELWPAFDRVRDATIRGKTPLVFWDEFDSGSFMWLKEFLAPMQDAEFRADGVAHPFGKAIFVFAGGTASTFEAFDQFAHRDDTREAFRLAKGPDFISRLRGYVNIKGPNPAGPSGDPAAGPPNRDVPHLIRRAIGLRSMLERLHPQLFDANGRAAISGSVIRGFLRVRAFHHGARSLEAVVGMSALTGARHFGVAELPSASLLRLHVSADFMDRVREGEIEESMAEQLAAATHDAWAAERRRAGWRFGPVRSDAEKVHPLLVPYAQLEDEERERSRHSARETLAKLHALGYMVVPARAGSPGSGPAVELPLAERERLAAIEHDAWLRNRLLHGYAQAPEANERLRFHPDVVPFDQLSARSKALAMAITTELIDTLSRNGYVLVRAVADRWAEGDDPQPAADVRSGAT